MVIQHNIAAINSYRNLGINQSSLNKNLEKLSSGYKINRAGDDAAGLAISEAMRSQINGLNQAAKNAQDAVGLIQTVEGALTETHSMLQRLTTLANQSANGTYNSVARANLQSEVDELLNEIDRVANYTDFNGIKPIANDSKNNKNATVDFTNKNLITTKPTATGSMSFQIGPSAKETISVDKMSMTSSGIGVNVLRSKEGGKGSLTDALLGGTLTIASNGAIESQRAANTAITLINKAIDQVSTYRAKLGAAQNRLEHTVSNLKVTSENITAAESRIRDTDMADEMTAFTKNNILLQASQSMLAQSNSLPQGVLSLLS